MGQYLCARSSFYALANYVADMSDIRHLTKPTANHHAAAEDKEEGWRWQLALQRLLLLPMLPQCQSMPPRCLPRRRGACRCCRGASYRAILWG